MSNLALLVWRGFELNKIHRYQIVIKDINREQLHEPYLTEMMNGVSHQTLTLPTFANLEQALIGYGNTLSEDHKAALMELVGSYTKIIKGEISGRYAFGLDTGMGKTTSIIALCKSLHQIKANHVGILICQSKVEALCDLKRLMIEAGIPEGDIGLIHSYKDASYPSTNDQRQFQLVTHTRARSEKVLSHYQWNNKKRDLIIWDESLITSDSFALPNKEIDKAIYCLETDIDNNPAYVPLINHLKDCLAQATQALDQLKQLKVIDKKNKDSTASSDAITCRLPSLSEVELVTYSELLSSKKTEWYYQCLSTLLDISNMEVRPAIASGGDGIICYKISVPKELTNIVILDASWHIRELERLDTTIHDISKFITKDIKRYDKVTITQIKGASGRSALTKDLIKTRSSDRKITATIIEIMKSIPETEKVLIFTFKDKQGLSMAKVIQSDLIGAGINLKTPLGEDRLFIETWGNETSSNSYSECTNIILAGLLHLPKLSMISALVGQKDNIKTELISGEVESVYLSEIAHRVFQALSRGSCRKVTNGYAQPMNAWLIYPNQNLKPLLEKVMGGIKWIFQGEVDKDKTGITYRTVMEIIACLSSVPIEVKRLSTRSFKDRFPNFSKTPPSTFRDAVNLVNDYSQDWTLDGRSLIRTSELFEAT